MSGVERFSWRGEPIGDIRAWARARREPMVNYHAERKVPNILTGQLDTETMDGSMPMSFFANLRMTDGWHYTETGREDA